LTKWVPAESAPLLVWIWPANLSQDEISRRCRAGQSRRRHYRQRSRRPALDACPQLERRQLAPGAGGLAFAHHSAGATAGGRLEAEPSRGCKTLGQSAALARTRGKAPARRAQRRPVHLRSRHRATTPSPASSPRTALPTRGITRASSSLARPQPLPAITPPAAPQLRPYPVRTDWVTTSDSDAGAKLSHLASLLAKVHGWLELADSPADVSTSNYYSLALVSASSATPLPAGQPAREGGHAKDGSRGQRAGPRESAGSTSSTSTATAKVSSSIRSTTPKIGSPTTP